MGERSAAHDFPIPETLQQDADRPKHDQVRARLLHRIASMHSGDQLPPERQLAAEFGVSRMTLRQAIAGLVASGYVSKVQGAGTFVAGQTISKSAELTGFSEDMVARGLTPSSVVLAVTEMPAAGTVAQELMITPGDLVYRLERVRSADGIPLCHELIEIPARLVPGLGQEDLSGSLYRILSSRYGIEPSYADQAISATAVGRAHAEMLLVTPRSPALVVKRVTYDRKGRPIERAISTYRGDKYDIRTTIHRSNLADRTHPRSG